MNQLDGNTETCDDADKFYAKWEKPKQENRIAGRAGNPLRGESIYDTHSIHIIDRKYESKSEQNDHDNAQCILKRYMVCPIGPRGQREEERKLRVISIKRTYLLISSLKLQPVHGLYWNPETHHLLMEMEKLDETLKDYVQYRSGHGNHIEELECSHIIYDLLQPMRRLHQRGWIHGDIKPENIMCKIPGNQRKWYLIDYDDRVYTGLGADSKKRACEGVGGTAGWTPPEISPLNKKGVYNYFTYAADIWPLGLIILYILFGEQPYDLTEKEERKCKFLGDRYSEYFYKNKLMKKGKYNMDSDKNKGELWLRDYLISLYVQDKISKELFDLLDGNMLSFDPRKRSDCDDIWKHLWFDGVRKDMKFSKESK